MSIEDPNILKKMKKIEERLDRIEERLSYIENRLGRFPSHPPPQPGPIPPPGPPSPPGHPPEPFRIRKNWILSIRNINRFTITIVNLSLILSTKDLK